MKGSKCQSIDLTDLLGVKIVQTKPTKQNSGAFSGFFSKFPTIIPRHVYMWEFTPRDLFIAKDTALAHPLSKNSG